MAVTLASCATRTQPLCGDRSADRWSFFRTTAVENPRGSRRKLWRRHPGEHRRLAGRIGILCGTGVSLVESQAGRLCHMPHFGYGRRPRCVAVVIAAVGMLCLLPPRVYAQTTQSEQDGIDAAQSVNEVDAPVDRAAEDGGVTASPGSNRPEPATSAATTRPVRLIDDAQVSNWWRSFVWAMVLVLVFVFGSLAIIVFSRRFRAYLTGRPQEHTPCDDVWQMHKLPPAPPPEAGDDDE